MKTRKKVLEDAIELLERDGWVKNAWKLPDGQRCLVQALNDAGAKELPPSEFTWVKRTLRSTYGCESLVEFNDDFWTTWDVVLGGLRKALAANASQEPQEGL